MAAEKFYVERHEIEESIQLHIGGELDLAAAAPFRDELEAVVHRTDKALILDLARLSYIDSTGIGILVSVVKIRDERNAPLYVRHIPAGIQKLFELTGISRFLNEGVSGSA